MIYEIHKFSRVKVPAVNPLLSVLRSCIISCFNVELVITASFSSFYSKYVYRSPSLCVKKLIIVETGPTDLFCSVFLPNDVEYLAS